VADVFRPRIKTGLIIQEIVASYVDNRRIAISAQSVERTKEAIIEYFREYNKVAKGRSMSFCPGKGE